MNTPLTIEDMLTRYPGTTKQSWAQQRYRGTGPKFIKVGRRVYYRLEDVEAWEEDQSRVCTKAVVA
ncbi:DNA-binding protein [Corynebacterium mastitidis]|uniref:DNA-binding protein n=1 Tax=Corynebacterium mastitidis TaxID=161890 RepID=A0ABU8P0U2_9CORY